MKNSITASTSNQRKASGGSRQRRPFARIASSVAGLVAGVALIAAASMVFTLELEDGFTLTKPHPFRSSSHAIVAHHFTELADPPSWLIDEIRVQGASEADSGLFVGVAPTAAVERYLNGVGHDEITAIEFEADKTLAGVEYATHLGTGVPPAPGLEQIWVASARGSSVQTPDWPAAGGGWTAVIMNADGSAPVAADLALGMKISGLAAIGWIAMAAGIASLAGGTVLAISGRRQLRIQRKSESSSAALGLARHPSPIG